ncbi:MAG: hypothetical protein MUC79_08290 [Thiobacillaceae bacterium]|jgi:hypothetical protein|nr:hypothetical protein [Thiobacillaceae bacterium]
MQARTLKKTLGILALSALSLSPLAAQAAFCPLGAMSPGGPGAGSQSCDRQGSCPTDRHADRHTDQRAHFNLLDRLEERQSRHAARIDRGLEEGAITIREAHQLMREQWDIERMQRRFLSDGFLTRQEFAALDGALDRAGRNIRHQARDDEGRW